MTFKPSRKLRSASFRRDTARFDTGLKVTHYGCSGCGYCNRNLGRLAPVVTEDDIALAFEEFQDDWDVSFDDYNDDFDSSYEEERRWKGDNWPVDPTTEDNPLFEDIRDYPDEYELEAYYFDRGWDSHEDPEYAE